ncbi:AsnC family transcriptional regulator [Mesorhizobium erdmanii]|uniref:AsnC family transcriptional regulator n=2 Tax=Mesorhizobium TaxID=68287 RepID=A0A3M9X196_9HYPH|nr:MULTISPECIES: Lrp/AsnC family transcriptional regulator [Mesorhizobium]RNJ41799.1 AsnC family transcriptional regulator [Mesorhizobium japonicum]RXT42841.1 AsnC family transcriptional regulator [Mesorhizobium erdmanii]
MQVSAKDRQLLMLLAEDARTPIAVLARRLDLSRTTVQTRLDRLEQEGVIAGYGVRLSDTYEHGLVRAHVMIVLKSKALGAVVRALRALPEVMSVHSVSGGFDLIADVAAPSISELDKTIDVIGDVEGVEKTQSSIILSTRFQR